MKCGAIILAAGAATRFGSPKQLAELHGETLLQRAIRTCEDARLEPIVIVLGANADAIQQRANLESTVVVINENWRRGMGTSLQKGVEALMQTDADGASVLTCDMPFVGADHLRALVRCAEETGRSVGSRYENQQGVPACFVRGDFNALAQLSGDSGGKALLKDAPFVELEDASDIDTPAQMLMAQGALTTES